MHTLDIMQWNVAGARLQQVLEGLPARLGVLLLQEVRVPAGSTWSSSHSYMTLYQEREKKVICVAISVRQDNLEDSQRRARQCHPTLHSNQRRRGPLQAKDRRRQSPAGGQQQALHRVRDEEMHGAGRRCGRGRLQLECEGDRVEADHWRRGDEVRAAGRLRRVATTPHLRRRRGCCALGHCTYELWRRGGARSS